MASSVPEPPHLDIAQNHAQKKQRRLAPAVALARELKLPLAQTRLRAALESATLV